MDRIVVEDAALEPPVQPKDKCRCRLPCRFTFKIPTLQELFQRDKRLLRSILLITILLNVPIGKFILYPFLLFSTWIHELFHGFAALSIGGKIQWLNIYPNGSGLAYTSIPNGVFERAWVASAGYQGTAIAGGIMLMFRRTAMGARIGVFGLGLIMLVTCALYVRNAFGLFILILMGIILTVAGSGVYLSSFWVSELYALLAATTCLNTITSIHVLFFVSESSIGGVSRTSDATTMQDVTKVPYWIWACFWMVLALCMSVLGVLIVFETTGNEAGRGSNMDTNKGSGVVTEDSQEGLPLSPKSRPPQLEMELA